MCLSPSGLSVPNKVCFGYPDTLFFILATLSGWTSGEASSIGLSNILHCSVPELGIAGLPRCGVFLLTSVLINFCFYQSYPRGQNAFTSVQKKPW